MQFPFLKYLVYDCSLVIDLINGLKSDSLCPPFALSIAQFWWIRIRRRWNDSEGAEHVYVIVLLRQMYCKFWACAEARQFFTARIQLWWLTESLIGTDYRARVVNSTERPSLCSYVDICHRRRGTSIISLRMTTRKISVQGEKHRRRVLLTLKFSIQVIVTWTLPFLICHVPIRKYGNFYRCRFLKVISI